MLLCGRLMFTRLHLSLFMSFRSGTGCFLRARRVKNSSRASSNRLTTRNRNFNIRFLKVQGTDPWIKKVFEFFVSSFTEDHPLFAGSGLQEKQRTWDLVYYRCHFGKQPQHNTLPWQSPIEKYREQKKSHWNPSRLTKHIHLIPKWRAINYSFVCTFMSPRCLICTFFKILLFLLQVDEAKRAN